MWELFCPEHGIPALISWLVLGMDPTIIRLTFSVVFGNILKVVKTLKGA